MAHRIDSVDSRNKLKPRRSPYWQKLSSKCHIGFRKMSASSEGTWLAQAYDPATQQQTRRSLGAFDDLLPSMRFDAAKQAAETWFKHMGMGGSNDIVSVKSACQSYVSHVRETKGLDAAEDIESRFKRWVYLHPIAAIELPKLNKKHIDAWRRFVSNKDVVINPHAEEKLTRKRAPSSVNRDMTPLRAALNHALDNAEVTTDQAWRVALRPIKNANGQRDIYLDRAQRSALIGNSPSDLADLLRGLAIVPLRPGALAALTVSSYDKRRKVLTIGKDKSGGDRKIKLPDSTAAFFAEKSVDKLPNAPLFTRMDGKQWDRHSWKKLVKAAALSSGLSNEVTAYAMRHSAITDLVTSGLDLLTVAQLSGTSVAMIERHYGHLRADHAAAALAGLAL